MSRRTSALFLLLLSVTKPVAAQIASGGESVLFRSDAAGLRSEPDYAAPPLNLGPLQANLSITARTVADSNIFRAARSGGDDVYFEVSPSIRLLANLGPHSVTFGARAAAKRYWRFARENSETIGLSYAGRIDLGAGSRATWNTEFTREVESRGAAGSNVVAAEPAEFQVLQANWSTSTELGRMGIGAALSIVQRSYMPLTLKAGGVLDQSFRDTRTARIAPRASFGVAGSAAVFVAGSAIKTTSVSRSQGGLRDSTGYTLLAGFRTETDGLVVGELGVGWRGQQYRNPLFSNFSGLTYDATVDWYPTRLISLRVQAGQDVVNSGLPNVAGILRRSVSARAYYDPLRNLRFNLALDRDHDAFRELRFSTSTVTATLTGTHQLGRHLDVSAYARLQSKDTSNSLRLEGYNSFAIGVALTGTL